MSEHNPDCDVNDVNVEGIKKPCNCGAPSSFAEPSGLEANNQQHKNMTKEPTHIIYGDGRIKTNKGKVEGRPCLTMRDTGKTLPVGTTSLEGPITEPQENFDVIISFRNMEGARLLQDMLNELVAEWSREVSQKIESL